MNKKLLIVDDEELVIKAIKQKFELEGFDVISDMNGNDALKIAQKEHPDIILIDVSIPGINGNEMVKELRKDDWGKTVPVMFITNSLGLNHLVEPTEYGPQDFLVKSDWKLSDIVSKVKTSLKIN